MSESENDRRNSGRGTGQTRRGDEGQGSRARSPSQRRPSSDAPTDLLDGERLIVDARPAWSAWTVQLVVVGGLALFGLVALIVDSVVAGISLFLFAGVLLGYVLYQRKRVRYLVTDRRIIVKTGISGQSTNEAWMRDVRGMQTGASFIERLLGHGHITVSTSILPQRSFVPFGGQFAGMTLGGIGDYQEVANVIRQQQQDAKMR